MKYLNKSLTKKNYLLIINIAIPMIIANLSTPLLGIVDTAIVGRISIEQIGAIAIGSTILSFIYFCFGFFRMGTTGLAAQAWGNKNINKINEIFINNIILALIISLICIFTIIIFKDLILFLFTNDEITKNFAKSYLLIRIFEAPAKFINFIIIGILLGCNKPWQVFKLVLFVNILNIILDLIFGILFGFELNGIAFGTLISEYICLILGIYIIRKEFINLSIISSNIEIKNFKNIFNSNFNLFIRTLFILISILMFTAIGSRLGPITLAAIAILISIQMFISYGLDGFAQAAEVLVGNNYKNTKKNNLINIIILTGLISFFTAVLISIILFIFGNQIIFMISPIEEVVSEANKYLIWIILSPLISFLSFYLDGVFIGANLTKTMRNSVFISFIIYLILIYLLVPYYNNYGLWSAFIIFMLFRGVLLFLNLNKVFNLR